MNRNDFLADACVNDFLVFFASCMSNLEVCYDSDFVVLTTDRHFHVTGVEQALARYAWPGKDTLSPVPHPDLYDWPSTSDFLRRARLALHSAISTGNEAATREVAIKILEWGLNPKGVEKNIVRLDRTAQEQMVHWFQYLENVRHTISLAAVDTDNITANLIPYASSGTCKIHSLASTDGLVIFDSRVAAMLGECINEFLRRRTMNQIPDPLKILVELTHRGTRQRRPRPLNNGSNHRGFVRNYRWIECQVRASWIFEEALVRNPAVFAGHPLPERMHRLEAAAFMMGAYLEPGLFNGRCFNFDRV